MGQRIFWQDSSLGFTRSEVSPGSTSARIGSESQLVELPELAATGVLDGLLGALAEPEEADSEPAEPALDPVVAEAAAGTELEVLRESVR
ncbi:hypothetical protein [Arthrobacter sp. lap29]|uniref:hypothetical protein n=1 Tax=Arthrobacter sp. lap29 TaxID=3056122 RepID=UPI0028F74E2B|nr:hypothetical protein [Arthrobacter sp. lap29]